MGSRAILRRERGVLSRHAVIDVGSNTIHLLVADVDGGEVLPVTGEKVSARLGSRVQKTGRIEEERLALGAEAIGLFARISALNGVSHPAILATSAVRDAQNGPELMERVRETTGLKGRMISGDEEAMLGFRGAASALGASWGKRALVVDLGGGSAQLILGEVSGKPERHASLPLGSNRMTERFVDQDPAPDEELEALRKFVIGALPDWEVDGAALVAIGGSARAILKLTGDALTVERLWELSREIRRHPSAVLARENGLTPERARVLPAAITTLAAILERYGKPKITVARGGVREGALLTLAEGGEI